MRIGRLLCVFAIMYLYVATPLHAALGDAPRCFPLVAARVTDTDAHSAIPLLRRVAPSYTSEDRDYLIRMIVFEASGEPEEGKAAVAHVILNRTRSGRWGDNIRDVVTHPWQFEPWMTKQGEIKSLPSADPRYQSAAQIADDVLTGQRIDPTAGATHFLNPTIVRKRRGGSLPAWAGGKGHPIGRHVFYSPDESDRASKPAALSSDTDSTSAQTTKESGEASLILARSDVLAAAGDVDNRCGRHPLAANFPESAPGNLVRLSAK